MISTILLLGAFLAGIVFGLACLLIWSFFYAGLAEEHHKAEHHDKR